MKKLITYVLIVCLGIGLYPLFTQPQQAAAGAVGGGAFGASANVSVVPPVLPSVTVTLAPVAPVTLPPAGGGPVTSSVLTASAGAVGLPVLSTGVITDTTSGVVTAGGSSATGSSAVNNANVLSSLVTADTLVATANSTCNGVAASSTGSLVVTNLVVSGAAAINGAVAPNSVIAATITLPVVGAVAASVTLNEQIPTGDGVLTSGLTVNAIHVRSSGTTVAGMYNVDVIIASANSSVVCMANVAPSITPVVAGMVTRQQGSPGTVSTIATVSDPEDPAGSLVVTTVGPLPTGITVTGITNTNGTVTATVAAACNAAVGPNNVTLKVTDTDGTMTTGTLVVTVTANTPPVLGTYPNASVAVGQSTMITPSAAPTDNGSVASLTAAIPPGFTGTITGNPATGVITVMNAGPIGVYTVNLTATDNCGATTPASFQLTVNNTGPSIVTPPSATIVRQQGSPGTPSVIATVSDPDQPAGTLVVTVVSAPPGITVTGITNVNGTVTATVSASCTAALGANTVVLQVMDNSGSTATANLTVNVTPNTAPTIGAFATTTLQPGGSAVITPAAAPADNGSIASVTATAPGFTGTLTGNATTGAITVTNAGPVGTYAVNVQVTDNCGATTPATLQLLVVPGPLSLTIADPGSCTGPGGVVTITATATNTTGLAQPLVLNFALPVGLLALPGTGTANIGTVTVANASTVTFTTLPGTVAAGQTVTVSFQAQVGDLVTPSTTLTGVVTGLFGTVAVTASNSILVNCPGVGPGLPYPATSEVSDQKPGSVLVYNLYTSSSTPTTQNTRISLTNVNQTRSIAVHLFFVDGTSCSVADANICLTANQTASFLASDLDPGSTGYIVAIATDTVTGCPISFNFLIGDEYVKLSTGHAANLGAEAFAAIAGGLTACNVNSVTAVLAFDGISYNRVPRVLAVDNVPSRADGNDTLLVINRFGGNLATGASTLINLFGIAYDDSENALSFGFGGSSSSPGTCQFRGSLSNAFPRLTPRFETFIPAGRSGWLKIFSQADIGLLGAVLNSNPNAGTSAGAFGQGHNLHKLTLTPTVTLTIPIFPPNC